MFKLFRLCLFIDILYVFFIYILFILNTRIIFICNVFTDRVYYFSKTITKKKSHDFDTSESELEEFAANVSRTSLMKSSEKFSVKYQASSLPLSPFLLI